MNEQLPELEHLRRLDESKANKLVPVPSLPASVLYGEWLFNQADGNVYLGLEDRWLKFTSDVTPTEGRTIAEIVAGIEALAGDARLDNLALKNRIMDALLVPTGGVNLQYLAALSDGTRAWRDLPSQAQGVQSDWSERDVDAASYILNKPPLPIEVPNTDVTYTSQQRITLNVTGGLEIIGEAYTFQYTHGITSPDDTEVQLRINNSPYRPILVIGNSGIRNMELLDLTFNSHYTILRVNAGWQLTGGTHVTPQLNKLTQGDGISIVDQVISLVGEIFSTTSLNKLNGIQAGAQVNRTGAETARLLETLTANDRLDASAIKNLESGGYTTAAQLVAALEALMDDARLDASAIKNIPTAGAYSELLGTVAVSYESAPFIDTGFAIPANASWLHFNMLRSVWRSIRVSQVTDLPVAAAGDTPDDTNSIEVADQYFFSILGNSGVKVGRTSAGNLLIASIVVFAGGGTFDTTIRSGYEGTAAGTIVEGPRGLPGPPGPTLTGPDIVALLEALTLGNRLSYMALDDTPTIPPATMLRTAAETARLLEGLTGTDRLDASAIKNLMSGGFTTGAQLVTALSALTGSDRLPYSAIHGTPNLSGFLTAHLTGAQIVTLLEALTTGNRLSYTALDDTPTIPAAVTLRTAGETARLLETLAGAQRLAYSAIAGTPDLSGFLMNHLTGPEIVALLEALTDGNRLSYNNLDGIPDLSGFLTEHQDGDAIVTKLEGLADNDKLSYEDGLKDKPDLAKTTQLFSGQAFVPGVRRWQQLGPALPTAAQSDWLWIQVGGDEEWMKVSAAAVRAKTAANHDQLVQGATGVEFHFPDIVESCYLGHNSSNAILWSTSDVDGNGVQFEPTIEIRREDKV